MKPFYLTEKMLRERYACEPGMMTFQRVAGGRKRVLVTQELLQQQLDKDTTTLLRGQVIWLARVFKLTVRLSVGAEDFSYQRGRLSRRNRETGEGLVFIKHDVVRFDPLRKTCDCINCGKYNIYEEMPKSYAAARRRAREHLSALGSARQ